MDQKMYIMGIDLAGKKENPSGTCILKEDKILFKTSFTDDEIVEIIRTSNPG